MLTVGVTLGLMTWLSFVLSWNHLPKRIRRFSLKHPFMTDIFAAALAFVLLSSISSSTAAVIGMILTGLGVNFALLLANKKAEL